MKILLCALFTLAEADVQRLGHPSYPCRVAAHRALKSLGAAAMPVLLRHADHPSAEVRRRVAILLKPYEEEIADQRSHAILPTSWPRRPWLSLYDSPATRYLSQAREHVKTTGAPDWPEYREATRLWVRSLLLQYRPIKEIRDELNRMAAEERWWILQNGCNYKPPIKLPAGFGEK